MALRTLAARMRAPAAAAALRLSAAPRISPPTGTAPRFFTSFSFQQGRTMEDVYHKNLKTLKRMKDQERDINERIRTLNARSKFLKWSFRLLFPIPLVATVLKVAH